MRVRVLHAKLYAYALPGSTARQLFNSSTLLDSSTARQNSTDLDRPRAHPGTCSQPRLASTGSTATRQLLDSYSTATRQLLDSYSAGSTGKALTAPRQRPRQRLDGALTARQLEGSSILFESNRFKQPALTAVSVTGSVGVASIMTRITVPTTGYKTFTNLIHEAQRGVAVGESIYSGFTHNPHHLILDSVIDPKG